ncbi:MAG: tyrosine-type recombinase/integrase [Candidatus Micrarchaeales archaeon]|nr:tyrosine-type recombinase/integrase [Candidatus Micrarchaeales archaeon]
MAMGWNDKEVGVAEHALGMYLSRMRDNKDIHKANIKLINDYITMMKANAFSVKTQRKHAYNFEKIMSVFPNKPLTSASQEEVMDVVAKIQEMKSLGQETRAKIKITLKSVAKFRLGENSKKYILNFAWIRTAYAHEEKLTAEDLLTEKEQEMLIKSARNDRDRAILALLMDAPMRPHEVLSLRRKHLNMEAYPPRLLVPEGTKTGTRVIPLIRSAVFIARYLDTTSLKPDDPLFLEGIYTDSFQLSDKRVGMTYAALRAVLRKAVKRAGIEKRVWLYLTRHTVITRNGKKLKRSVQEKVSGWKPGSNMPRVYEHLTDDDTVDGVLEAEGLPPTVEKEKKTDLRVCTRCKYINPSTLSFCGRCGSPLDIAVALEAQEREDSLKKRLIPELLKDPAFIDAVTRTMEMVKREAKARK